MPHFIDRHLDRHLWKPIVLALCLLLAACGGDPDPTPIVASEPANTTSSADDTIDENGAAETTSAALVEAADTPVPTVPPTATPVPTPTPIPLAAIINGESLVLATFQTRLEQFQLWYPAGTPDGTSYEQFTLNNMITQMLVHQEAMRAGLTVDPQLIVDRINQAITDSGGEEGYLVWLTQSGLDEITYRQQVEEELLSQRVVEHITSDVPTTTEFVRARYIQVDELATAELIKNELSAGADFAALVALYSIEPGKDVTKGDLGFFCCGMLFVPEVEQAAFSLQPKEVSDILTVQRSDGSETHYIVETVSREPFRPLSPEQRYQLLTHTFETWLAEQRATAEIEILIDQPQ